jgi:hypothetical protein
MLTRQVPCAASTSSRSGVAVAGEVSTDSGTEPSGGRMSNRVASSGAVRKVGVPPPIAARL